ncbi:MAG: hypothetical protein ACREEP_03850 [Dongiaceae bacterium]
MTADRLELLLAFGLVFVYLVDSMRFLGHREALVERLASDRWRLSFGATRFEILGRRPAIPNPLRPDRVSCVAEWRLEADLALGAGDVAWPATASAAKPLGLLSLGLLGLVVLLAPALLVIGQEFWFAIAIGTAYLLAIGAASVLVWRADAFGLARWPAAGLGVIAVICLPCAPNLLRAACGGPRLRVNLPAFGETSADDADRRGFRGRFARLLRQEMWQGPDDDRQEQELQAILRHCEERS